MWRKRVGDEQGQGHICFWLAGGVMETSIAVFRGKEIRKTIHNNEWWFSVADVVAMLTESSNSSGYIKKMLKRNDELAKGWGQIITPLWLETSGGKQKVNCANTEGIFRIIQATPPQTAVNTLVCLIHQTNYLLDQKLRSLEKNF